MPHYVLDVRPAKAAEEAPLLGDLQSALRVPGAPGHTLPVLYGLCSTSFL